ncbi:MAG: component of the polarisome [Caeruleum heppii]|nr:MAG: component of the polarisome [Caeruleum heppii]
MTGRGPTLSPLSPGLSPGGNSEWSGISGYQTYNASDSPYPSATQNNRRPPHASPPMTHGSNGSMPPMAGFGMGRTPNDSPAATSPASSIARSSGGTGLYASSDSGQSRKGSSMFEDNLARHYTALRRFLASSVRDEKGNTRPNRARDKLLRLSQVQFEELSTDVYDELLRRQNAASQKRNAPGEPQVEPAPPYLLPEKTFHPKRNQARHKLATLPTPRFRDLATDVFYELERRCPRFVGGGIDRNGSPASSVRSGFGMNGSPMMPSAGSRPGSRGTGMRGPGPPPRTGTPGSSLDSAMPGNDYGRPLPKTFHSNTMIPNKSTMVEDDGDQTGPEDDGDERQSSTPRYGGKETDTMVAEYQSEIETLRKRFTQTESRLKGKEEELRKLQEAGNARGSAADAERQQWSDARSDLEVKLANALNVKESLQSALREAHEQSEGLKRELQHHQEQAWNKGDEDAASRARCEELERNQEQLQRQLRQQQSITDEVRSQAASFLREMKSLSSNSDDAWEREEELGRKVDQLEKEVRTWQSRYAKSRGRQRTRRASSDASVVDRPDVTRARQDRDFVRPDGIVKDIHVTKFQIAVDELLRSARDEGPSAATDRMRAVVASVKRITRDIDTLPASSEHEGRLRTKCQSRVSATATNLITASRNFASAKGISPISLLDAAASHLAAAVVELLRVAKIRPSRTGVNADDEDEDDSDDSEDDIASNPPNIKLELRGSSVFFPVDSGRASGESAYSPMTSPSRGPSIRSGDKAGNLRSPSRNGAPTGQMHVASIRNALGFGASNGEIEELKVYLEDQTEELVQSIQGLVGSIRGNANANVVRAHTDSIATTVGRVVSATESAVAELGNAALRNQSESAVNKLSHYRTQLREMQAEGDRAPDGNRQREVMNKLPPLAFEIARETKDLVQRIDQVSDDADQGMSDEDFR